MVLVGSPAVEPPGIPVDPGDVEIQRQLGKVLPHKSLGLGSQLHGGLVQAAEVLLLVGQKPASLVIETDAPEEIQSLSAVSGKHVIAPLAV